MYISFYDKVSYQEEILDFFDFCRLHLALVNAFIIEGHIDAVLFRVIEIEKD
jgi:hypothetical protein